MAGIELHVNATYYAQRPVIGGRLFSFLQDSELSQGLQDWNILK